MSHAPGDASEALRLESGLRGAGFDVVRSRHGGDTARAAAPPGLPTIPDAHAIVPVVSTDYLTLPACLSELGTCQARASSSSTPLVPVFVETIDAAHLDADSGLPALQTLERHSGWDEGRPPTDDEIHELAEDLFRQVALLRAPRSPEVAPSQPDSAPAPVCTDPRDVFISYASEDAKIAESICSVFEDNGVTCWIAPRDIAPGRTYGGAIIEGLNSCRVLVLVYTARANASRDVAREVERAESKNLAIIPFRLEDVPLSPDLEYFLSAPQWFEGQAPPLEAQAERLATSIRQRLHPELESERRGSGPSLAQQAWAAFIRFWGTDIETPPQQWGMGLDRMRPTPKITEERLENFENATKWIVLGLSIATIPLFAATYLFDLSPTSHLVIKICDYTLWALFSAEYFTRLILARRRLHFVAHHILDLLLVVVPFLRVLRLARPIIALVRTATALLFLGRAIEGGGRVLGRHPTLYALLVAAVVSVAGMIVVHDFESHHKGARLGDWSTAAKWTVRTVATAGSETTWPLSIEGQVVRIVLVLIGLGLFGVVTATMASWLVRNREEKHESERHAELKQRLDVLHSSFVRSSRQKSRRRSGNGSGSSTAKSRSTRAESSSLGRRGVRGVGFSDKSAG